MMKFPSGSKPGFNQTVKYYKRLQNQSSNFGRTQLFVNTPENRRLQLSSAHPAKRTQ